MLKITEAFRTLIRDSNASNAIRSYLTYSASVSGVADVQAKMFDAFYELQQETDSDELCNQIDDLEALFWLGADDDLRSLKQILDNTEWGYQPIAENPTWYELLPPEMLDESVGSCGDANTLIGGECLRMILRMDYFLADLGDIAPSERAAMMRATIHQCMVMIKG